MGFERKSYNMDREWKFHLGDIRESGSSSHNATYHATKSGGATGPAGKGSYDDSDWQRINLPHDYLAATIPTASGNGSHGYREYENGWYRKTFRLDPTLAGSHALLVFEGISTSSVIYLNGSVVARSNSGYTEIAIDVTDRIYFDKINTLAVYVNGDKTEGWWYEGAGIYRHVHLYVKNSLHIAHNGAFVKPRLVKKSEEIWEVNCEIEIENSAYTEGVCGISATLLDGDKTVVTKSVGGCTVPADGKVIYTLTLPVSSPERWDVDNPRLYSVEITLTEGDETVDRELVRCGFRTFSIDCDRGFFLNDRPLKIKGTCNHQDHAGVGVALPDSLQYYRIRRLKELGTNAYRCSHNPPARAILDACDEYGLIVMDENRAFEASEEALSNLEMLVKRDRNHPSVIFYSLFNEEPLQNSREGKLIFSRQRSRVERLDDTRLITGAINDRVYSGGAGDAMDVLGINYWLSSVEVIHATHPKKPIIGSENNSAVTTRGCYLTDMEAHVLSGYDEETVPWGQLVRETWEFVRSHDYFSGIFIWTGFDYRGEPTPFVWPSVSSQFGIMDTCGFPKDSYYFNQATFIEEPMMYILPHWNYKTGDRVRVMTVTNCDEVELFLNGKSLGRRDNDVCRQNEWQVDFEEGEISAVGYREGKPVATYSRRTAGKGVSLRLTPDRSVAYSCGGDMIPVRVSVVDALGVELPLADNLVRFRIEGEGYIGGVGNGDPNSLESDVLPERRLYAGLCQVLVGVNLNAERVRLIAESDGLLPAEYDFNVVRGETPDYIGLTENLAVEGILADVSDREDKPDPCQVYGEDDNNSLAPVILEENNPSYLPMGFASGWRLYRIPIKLPRVIPEGGCAVLAIGSLVCSAAEFYIDGELIHSVGETCREAVILPLPEGRREYEVRALLRAHESGIGGIARGVALSFIKE